MRVISIVCIVVSILCLISLVPTGFFGVKTLSQYEYETDDAGKITTNLIDNEHNKQKEEGEKYFPISRIISLVLAIVAILSIFIMFSTKKID